MCGGESGRCYSGGEVYGGRRPATLARRHTMGVTVEEAREFSSYRLAFGASTRYQYDLFMADAKRSAVYPRETYVVNPPRDHKMLAGAARLIEFEKLIYHGLHWQLHQFQKEFLGKTAEALAEQIVGEDWARIGEGIMHKKKWTKCHIKQVIARAPRRFGKSVSVGKNLDAYGLVMPRSTQVVFSTGRRASRNLLEIAYNTIAKSGFLDWICKYDAGRAPLPCSLTVPDSM